MQAGAKAKQPFARAEAAGVEVDLAAHGHPVVFMCERSCFFVGSGNGNSIILTAGNEDTGEVFTMSAATGSVTLLDHSYSDENVTFTYSDGQGGQYVNINADGTKNGAFKVTDIDTINQTISGNFSFVGRNATGQNVPFFNGTFQKISFSGTMPAPGGPQILDAKIDSLGVVSFKNMARVNMGGTVSIKGADFATSTSLELVFNDVVLEAGTYELDDEAEEDIDIIYYTANGNSYTSTAGTLTIDSYENNWLTGKFTFTGTMEGSEETLQITEGDFYIYLE